MTEQAPPDPARYGSYAKSGKMREKALKHKERKKQEPERKSKLQQTTKDDFKACINCDAPATDMCENCQLPFCTRQCQFNHHQINSCV